MALRKPDARPINDDAMRVIWSGIKQGDTCEPWVGGSEYGDRSAQITGTPGTGSLAVQGSNDESAFSTLTDPFGVALTALTGGIKQVLEYTAHVKPLLAGGDANTDFTVTLVARRNRR